MGVNPSQTLSALSTPELVPLRSLGESFTPANAHRVLVVAPHPDDETLGCGGAIALLHQLGCDVRVLVMSDGTQSHPNSRRYPALALKALREDETRTALLTLGVSAVTFLGLPDGAVPDAKSAEFAPAVYQCERYLEDYSPQVVFVPWRADPHPDHRATWQLIDAALHRLPRTPRRIEYPIWDWDTTQRGDCPTVTHHAWRLNIGPVAALKQRAIAAYRSQTTNLIDDDPDGFRLTPEMLAQFGRSWELYFEEF